MMLINNAHQNVESTPTLHHKKNLKLLNMQLNVVLLKWPQNILVNYGTKNIPRTSMYHWLNKYLSLQEKSVNSLELDKAFVETKSHQGRPTLLPTDLHHQLLVMLRAIRDSDGFLSPLIVTSVANGILQDSNNSHLLLENGGHIQLNRVWARGILKYSLNYTKRKPTTTRKLTAEDWQHWNT